MSIKGTPLYVVSVETATLHLSMGNSKIGRMFNFSTLPGNETHLLTLKNGQVLTDIPGTCTGLCEECFYNGCYAVNSARQYHNTVIPAWAENTLLLRSGKVWELLEAALIKNAGKVKFFRINVSGELQNVDDIVRWNTLAHNHPEVTFAFYTKNLDALDLFFQQYEDTEPNLIPNVSNWNHCADWFIEKYAGKVNVFEYDPTNLKSCDWSEEDRVRLFSLPHCPAVTKDGKHAKKPNGDPILCEDCRRCYRKTGKTTAVYAHGTGTR